MDITANITKLHLSCRGPLVIYSQSVQFYHRLRPLILQIDDNDPLKYLYDIDDGKGMRDFSCCLILTLLLLASTVITLADWYHGLSTVLFPNPDKEAP